MAICPFLSTHDEKGNAQFYPCINTCALFYKGVCSLQIMGAKAWKDAGFGRNQKESASDCRKDES